MSPVSSYLSIDQVTVDVFH